MAEGAISGHGGLERPISSLRGSLIDLGGTHNSERDYSIHERDIIDPRGLGDIDMGGRESPFVCPSGPIL